MSTTALPTGFDQARELLADFDARIASVLTPEEARLYRETIQEELLFAHLRDLWLTGQLGASFVLTPRVVERELDYEVDHQLTTTERFRIIDDVMNSPAVDDLLATVNADFREIVREIVAHHVGRRP